MSAAKVTVQALIDQLRADSDKGIKLPNLVEVAEGIGWSGDAARDGAKKGTVPALLLGGRWKCSREVLRAWRDAEVAVSDRIARSPSAPAASVRQRQLDETARQLQAMGVEV